MCRLTALALIGSVQMGQIKSQKAYPATLKLEIADPLKNPLRSRHAVACGLYAAGRRGTEVHVIVEQDEISLLAGPQNVPRSGNEVSYVGKNGGAAVSEYLGRVGGAAANSVDYRDEILA